MRCMMTCNKYKYGWLLYHKKDIDKIVKEELSYLIDMKRHEKGPFSPGIVEKYYNEFEKIKKC